MIPPLSVAFEVEATPEHAFATWVERAEVWWPRGHTLSGAPAAIVFEPFAGGRIYERDAHGAELAWGEVVVWEPPNRIEYLWHLFFPRSEATHVAITFTPTAGGTSVQILQTGWDALGEQGLARREGNTRGWAAVSEQYRRNFEASREESQ